MDGTCSAAETRTSVCVGLSCGRGRLCSPLAAMWTPESSSDTSCKLMRKLSQWQLMGFPAGLKLELKGKHRFIIGVERYYTTQAGRVWIDDSFALGVRQSSAASCTETDNASCFARGGLSPVCHPFLSLFALKFSGLEGYLSSKHVAQHVVGLQER